MNTDQIIETAIQGHASTRDAIRWAIQQIVKECARIARATPCPYEDDEARQRLGHTWDMASIEAGRGIVKHFGVEE